MEATITTIGDVFRKKVEKQITESYDAPTIWVDFITGEEHEDYDYLYVESRNPNGNCWESDPKASSYVEYGGEGNPYQLIVNGPIKQVGSHVTECGSLFDSRFQIYPFLDQLDKVFKYAKNLRAINGAFAGMNTGNNDLVIPENLFWNCPKIEELYRPFWSTKLKTIPSRLLEKCPKLELASCLFYNTEIEEIPEDLFKNNPKIKDLSSAFAMTNVKKIPNGLLAQFKKGIKNNQIDITDFVEDTPIEQAFLGDQVIPSTAAEKRAKRNLYFPSYLSKKVQWLMIGNYTDYGYDEF